MFTADYAEKTARLAASPLPFATCARAARHSAVASMTAAWRSTIIPPGVLCAASRSAAKTISSPVPTLAAAAPPPCTRCSKPKLNGLDPQLDLTDDLGGIADHPARQIAELLPMALASC
jgi:hypothetical protein